MRSIVIITIRAGTNLILLEEQHGISYYITERDAGLAT